MWSVTKSMNDPRAKLFVVALIRLKWSTTSVVLCKVEGISLTGVPD